MNFKDNDILTGITSGNKEVFDLVFRRYYSELCIFANDYVHSPDIAQEITQDMFVYLWENHSRIQIKISLKAYLYRSVHNRCMNYFRSKTYQMNKEVLIDNLMNHDVLLSTEISETVFDLLFSEKLEHELEKTIEMLPEQCRIIFEMNRYENLSYKEIADRLEVSASTVRTQIARALHKIRNKMSKYL
jgi:RNA polymerase sigma-70 factor (family 1)